MEYGQSVCRKQFHNHVFDIKQILVILHLFRFRVKIGEAVRSPYQTSFYSAWSFTMDQGLSDSLLRPERMALWLAEESRD